MSLRNTLLFGFVLVTCVTFSQSRNRHKYELVGCLGPTNFLGELGGANQIGTHFVRDFDFNATRFCLGGGIRYKDHPRYAFKGMLTFAMLSGNDALTDERFRRNRNLSFRAPLLELSVQAEYYFIADKSKNLYTISGIKKKKRKRSVTWYVFTGVGGFLFVPQAKYDGSWYKLRKLHTEGQGLSGGPKQYSNFNICIPVGVGCRYQLNKKWSVGAELSARKTFTDYIDDVSTTYYDKSKIAATYGPVAAALSDPSLGEIPGATMPNGDGTAAQRGQPKYKDAYMFFSATVGYKFTKRARTRAKF